jgi:D-alanyl-D-alanine carboxypeptidase
MFRFLLFAAVAVGLAGQDFAAKADAFVQSWVRDGQFRGAVLVAKDGKPVFRKAYGLANEEWDIANTPETKFRLGSITKQFTAAAVLQLAEKGKLKLDDAVKVHYPEAPAAWDKITIHHLLNHTSGIKSYTGLPGFMEKRIREKMTPVEIVKLTQDMPLEFEPGEKFAYNNTGYVLLGAIIEKASGQSYGAYLQQNVFAPLGMADSGYDSDAAIIKRRASGYTGGRNAPFIDMSLPHAAGSLYSTVDDLVKWSPAKVVSTESFTKMKTPGKQKYGYGIFIDELKGHAFHGHGGGINGFNTSLTRFPDDGLVVAVLCNQNSSAPDRIGRDLGRLYFGDDVPPRPLITKVTVSPEKLDQLAGRYELNPNFVLRVWREGEKMLTQATGQGQVEVVPTGESVLYQALVDARLEFTRGEDGKATGLTLHQNGRSMPAKRLE